jgi:hypothetical protein
MTDIEYDFLSPGDTIINEGSISRNLPAELQIPNLVVHIRDIDGSFATLVFNDKSYQNIPRGEIIACFSMGSCKRYNESLKWKAYDKDNWYFKTKLGYIKIFKYEDYWIASFSNMFINKSNDLDELKRVAIEWVKDEAAELITDMRVALNNIL